LEQKYKNILKKIPILLHLKSENRTPSEHNLKLTLSAYFGTSQLCITVVDYTVA